VAPCATLRPGRSSVRTDHDEAVIPLF